MTGVAARQRQAYELLLQLRTTVGAPPTARTV
jgi:hypothetical protein